MLFKCCPSIYFYATFVLFSENFQLEFDLEEIATFLEEIP